MQNMSSSPRRMDQGPDSEVLKVLSQLEGVTTRLQALGRLIATVTLLSFLSTLLVGALEQRVLIVRIWGWAFGLIFPLTAIAVVFQFDLLKRKGDTIFKELSDELQWYIRYGREEMSARSEPASDFRPQLRARIVLREYADSTSLSLVASANGPFTYASVNVGFALITVILSAFTKF